MGWLAAQGAIMAIGLFIGLVCSVIGLFFGHIILFDSIALGIAAGVCCNQFTAIHPALCLVIGIATFLLLVWLHPMIPESRNRTLPPLLRLHGRWEIIP